MGFVRCFIILRRPTHGAHQEKIKLSESYWTQPFCIRSSYPYHQIPSSSCDTTQRHLPW